MLDWIAQTVFKIPEVSSFASFLRFKPTPMQTYIANNPTRWDHNPPICKNRLRLKEPDIQHEADKRSQTKEQPYLLHYNTSLWEALSDQFPKVVLVPNHTSHFFKWISLINYHRTETPTPGAYPLGWTSSTSNQHLYLLIPNMIPYHECSFLI